MPKVLRIINRFNLGGPTYNAGYLSGKINENCGTDDIRFETRLIGGSPAEGEAHSGYILTSLGVQYEEIPEMSRAVHPLRDLRAFFKILRIMREFKPDIVHTHAAKAGALGRLAARITGVPVVVHTYHGHVFDGYFSRTKALLARLAERQLGRWTSRIINISPELNREITEKYRICPADKTAVIPLGFDLNRFTRDQEKLRKTFRRKYSISPDEVCIGIVGRLAPVKNHALFLEVCAELQQRGLPFKAVVIGDGSLREEIETKARALGLMDSGEKDCLIFTSWIREVENAMAGLDLVVLTSLNEGTPVSLIEAEAAARPVVTTDVGGVRSCVDDGKSGFITASDTQALANALEKLIRDQDLREQFGNYGRSFVMEKFSYQRLVKDVRALYISELQKENIL